jgi:hypothetical protein
VPLSQLNFPNELTTLIKIKYEEEKEWVFDAVRNKWLVCTPEEWVRQHAVQYLIAKKYSLYHLQIETGLITGFNQKRSDLIANVDGKPVVLVECKSPYVKLSQETFNQAFNYNNTIGAKTIWLTNGLQNLYWDCQSAQQLTELPGPL